MTPTPGTTLTLTIEKPAAGGRMLARHEGQVVLVAGAIPGEVVEARVERGGKGVVYADTSAVVTPSGDRRASQGDPRCGGNVYAHIAYARQVALKGEIIRDALVRIGRLAIDAVPDVLPSPERGYRMRARLHAASGRLGFYREGTHQLCDPAPAGQLLESTIEWIREVETVLQRDRIDGITAVDVAENMAGDARGAFFELDPHAPRRVLKPLLPLAGAEAIADHIDIRRDGASGTLRLQRSVRAFFQGNRFLLAPLVQRVIDVVPPGPVIDLYAGVGLFGLSLAAAGADRVTCVEGDAISGEDLERNAAPFAGRVTVQRRSVEGWLRGAPALSDATVIVDPPRTGMSRDAVAGVIAKRPAAVVYVSCDVATLARDARLLADAGYGLQSLSGIDLFPNTAHVESLAVFARGAA